MILQREHPSGRIRLSWRAGFTLIELLCVIVLIACVVADARLVHARIGGGKGYLIGGVVGASAYLIGGLLLAGIRDGFGGMPRLPRCRDGCCVGPGLWAGDYGNYAFTKVGDTYVNVCTRGVQYARRGNRFVIVQPDGTETPYLIWRAFRGWYPDR